ncbi:MAG: hypothetical protein LBD38_04160 [Streptococcaceae bacterium]|jgi:hypothetical protein|nr:hypothetical protein [Streptococcaceae bacterium]
MERKRPFRFPLSEDDAKIEPTGRVLFEGENFLFGSIDDNRTTSHLEKNEQIPFDPSYMTEVQETKPTLVSSRETLNFQSEREKYDRSALPKFKGGAAKPRIAKEELNRRPSIPTKKFAPPQYKRETSYPQVKTWERSQESAASKRIQKYKELIEEDRKKPLQQQYSGGLGRFKSRVESKAVPQKAKKADYTENELYQSMLKSENSYFLMEVEEAFDSENINETSNEVKVWRKNSPRITAKQAKPIVTGINKESVRKKASFTKKPLFETAPLIQQTSRVERKAPPTEKDKGVPQPSRLKEESDSVASAPLIHQPSKVDEGSAPKVGASSTERASEGKGKRTFLEGDTFFSNNLTPQRERRQEKSSASVLTEKTKRKRALARDLTSLLQEENTSSVRVKKNLFDKNGVQDGKE